MKQKLNAKDFILIGVLTALMWIICMIISTIMSVAGPVTNVFYPSVVAIPNGIVMMLLLAKVPKKGVFTICAAIQAILFLLVGAFWFIPIGLVIGNEGEGVGRLVKEKCDMVASIPMKGDIDSLNASVAAGVLAYEIVRQRLQA